MRVSTDACDSFGNSPILFNERRNKTSEAHVHMNWHFSGMTVRSNNWDGITGAVRIVGIWGINANSILIDIPFHFANFHFKVFVERNDPGFNVEVITGLESRHMTCLANDQVGFENSMIFHFILPVCQYSHDDWLSSTRLTSAARQSLLIFQANCLRSHVNYLIFHLFHVGAQLIVQGVWVWKMFGKTGHKFTVSLKGVPRPWKLPLQGFLLRGIPELYLWGLVGYFI